jgi:hypothetical protein
MAAVCWTAKAELLGTTTGIILTAVVAVAGLVALIAPEGGHPHGRPASWVLVAVVVAVFATGGLAIIGHAWWLMWTCAGVIVLAIPAGKIIGIMDETVAWGSTPAATHDPAQDQETDPGRDQPVPARR